MTSHVDPASAYGAATVSLMRERADCLRAQKCVHGHANGVCPYDHEFVMDNYDGDCSVCGEGLLTHIEEGDDG